MRNNLEAVVTQYCSVLGMDPLLVQGAGGNVSWKQDNTLWVKASGTWLADATDKNIFVPVDLPHLIHAISENNFDVTPKLREQTTLKPSIETLLHALLPHRIVVHLHAIEILAYLVRETIEEALQLHMEPSISWALIDYYKPGPELAAAIHTALIKKPNSNVLFLKNHGVVIAGENIEEVDSYLNQLISTFKTLPDTGLTPTRLLCTAIEVGEQKYVPLDIPNIHHLVFSSVFYDRIKSSWALYPDHVVFLGPHAFCYENIEDFKEALASGYSPDLVFIKETGVFATSQFNATKKEQLKCFYHVIVRQPEAVSLQTLTNKQINELLNWDAEQYRQALTY